MRMLVRSPNWIGDFVMARDFLTGLRKAHSQDHLAIAIPEEFFELAHPLGFDAVIALSRAQRKFPSAVAYWATTVRRQQFDRAVTLAASTSGAFLLWAAGIPERLGYAETAARVFLTRSLPWKGRDTGLHKSRLYRDLLSLDGGQAATPQPLVTRSRGGPTIVLAPGASISLREWPSFVELAVRLRTEFPGHKIRIVGTASQISWQEKFEVLGDSDIESFIGLTTPTELLELLREARFVVANDSGVAHLAATVVGAPTVVLFGPGDPAYVTPIGPVVRVARAEGVLCSPCESARCHAKYGYQKCLKDLSVETVLQIIKSLN